MDNLLSVGFLTTRSEGLSGLLPSSKIIEGNEQGGSGFTA